MHKIVLHEAYLRAWTVFYDVQIRLCADIELFFINLGVYLLLLGVKFNLI